MPTASLVPFSKLESIFAAYENGDEEVRVEILTNFFTVGSNTVTPTPALESFASAEFARLVRLPFPNGSAYAGHALLPFRARVVERVLLRTV